MAYSSVQSLNHFPDTPTGAKTFGEKTMAQTSHPFTHVFRHGAIPSDHGVLQRTHDAGLKVGKLCGPIRPEKQSASGT